MKLVMDEKLKHRLIGLAVIISLGAIFAPAVMRKSSQSLENNFSVNVTLPPKPVVPDVAVVDKKDMFKTLKVARLNSLTVSEEKQLPELARAETIKTLINNESVIATVGQIRSQVSQPVINETAKVTSENALQMAANQPLKTTSPVVAKQKVGVKTAKVNLKPLIKQEVYAVQLASFLQIYNAQALVNRLRAKGYKANFIKTSAGQRIIYKVYVGHSPRKNDVVKLKTQFVQYALQILF